jgi:hypothetical protein
MTDHRHLGNCSFAELVAVFRRQGQGLIRAHISALRMFVFDRGPVQ